MSYLRQNGLFKKLINIGLWQQEAVWTKIAALGWLRFVPRKDFFNLIGNYNAAFVFK